MRRLGVSLPATAGLLAMFLAEPSGAQAWLPPQGEAFFSLGYGNAFITKHYTWQAARGEAPLIRGDNIEDDRGHIRLYMTRSQAAAFCDHADELVAAGRPNCQWCGNPIDPDGHPCPRMN